MVFGFDSLFWLTVLVIFLATITGAVLARVRKDKCLKLLHDHHVTYLTHEGAPLWGDLYVASSGLELRYDQPYVTSRGLSKASFLVLEDEWKDCLALCRVAHGLTEAERAARERQIRVSFDPGAVRRALRGVRNFVNTCRDAVTKSLQVFVGSLAGRGGAAQAVGQRKGEVGDVGEALVGIVGNAYEPLLERHVGRPVIVQLQGPQGRAEFPGFLVDYSQRFIAVFNVDHAPEEEIELETRRSLKREGLEVRLEEGKVAIAAPGPDALLVRRLEQGDRGMDLGVVLLPGCTLTLPRVPGVALRLRAERTRRFDLVCPRALARVRFGSSHDRTARSNWAGVAPAREE